MKKASIERVVVLGAGVMGAQIAAMAVNAGLHVELLDLPGDEDPAGRARAGIEGLKQLRPPALFLPELAAGIRPGSFDDAEIGQADWIIEAVVEDLESKCQLLASIAPRLAADAVISSNTSGLSIAALAAACPENVRGRFLGIHFFNPPRYMKLVEVIPGPDTDAEVVSTMSEFVGRRLGKGVVECRDTPNFIANRLGVFTILDALHRMQEHGLTVEEVDTVTGTVLGRPRSATLRLCDLIGLDTLVHVATTSHDNLASHPGLERLSIPACLKGLLEDGRLGSKRGAGFYRKTPEGLECVDLASLTYRPVQDVDCALPGRGALADRLQAVWCAEDRLGNFAREHLVATLAYCAQCVEEVAYALEDVDQALRWGFNWEAGAFEMIDMIGAERLSTAITASGADPSPLLARILAAEPNRVALGNGRQRQIFSPAPTDAEWLAAGELMMDVEGLRLVYLGEGAAAIELRGKLNMLPPDVLRHLQDAINREAFEVLALTGAGGHFSAGADLKYVLRLIDAGQWTELESYLQLFQETTSAVRYASVPVVAAARGLALGGGCELCLTAASRVVAGELRMGLVETKVGVIPGAGGCKEMVRRFGADVASALPTLQNGLMSDNALQARAWGFLGDDDAVYLDEERLLAPAIEGGRRLLAQGWAPPVAAPLEVAGPQVLASIEEELARGAEEGQLMAQEVVVGKALAGVLCGGGDGGPVKESRLLELEREAFLMLCGTDATRARIDHMLSTGKPLRN